MFAVDTNIAMGVVQIRAACCRRKLSMRNYLFDPMERVDLRVAVPKMWTNRVQWAEDVLCGSCGKCGACDRERANTYIHYSHKQRDDVYH